MVKSTYFGLFRIMFSCLENECDLSLMVLYLVLNSGCDLFVSWLYTTPPKFLHVDFQSRQIQSIGCTFSSRNVSIILLRLPWLKYIFFLLQKKNLTCSTSCNYLNTRISLEVTSYEETSRFVCRENGSCQLLSLLLQHVFLRTMHLLSDHYIHI